MKIGLILAVLALAYVFYPTHELLTRPGPDAAWASGGRTHWSLTDCRKAGAAHDGGEWRCRQNNPWYLLFRTGTRYDPDIKDSQQELDGG